MKKVIIIGSVLIIGLIIYALFYTKKDFDHEPEIIVKQVHSESLKDTIYFKKISWGLTYDNEIIVLSTSSAKVAEPDSIKEFVFLSPDIFYKVSQDSLIIYTPLKAKEPINFHSGFKIKQIELSNPELMDLRGYKHYKKLGLEMVE